MNAAQTAQRVRSIIRRHGHDSKGRVRTLSTDYTTELEVDLRGIYDESRDDIEIAINEIDDDGTFDWNVL